MKNHTWYCILLLLVSINSYGAAQCSTVFGNYPVEQDNLITVNPDIEIGQLVLRDRFSAARSGCRISASEFSPIQDEGSLSLYMVPKNLEKDSNRTYATFGLSGIGIGLSLEGIAYTEGKGWLIGEVYYSKFAGNYVFSPEDMSLNTFDWAWYKISEEIPGERRLGYLYDFMTLVAYDGDNQAVFYPLRNQLSVDLVLRNQACSFDNATITRTLNTIDKNGFSEIGYTAGYQDIVVPMTCTPNTKYSLQMSTRNPVNNIDTKLVSENALSNGAKGVGIELLYKNNSLPKSNGIYKIANSELPVGESNLLEFGAQYYQLLSIVTVGNIDAYFDLTVTYD